MRALGYRSSQQSLFVGSDDPTAADERLVVGGTQTWINNIEIESPIVKAAGLRAVVFVDAGNAFGDSWGNGSINFEDLRLAYGFGIRWLSPWVLFALSGASFPTLRNDEWSLISLWARCLILYIVE